MTDRETLGRLVRTTWIAWAKARPNPKPSWIAPWEELGEPDREVDRLIGDAIRSAVEAETAEACAELCRAIDCEADGTSQTGDAICARFGLKPAGEEGS